MQNNKMYICKKSNMALECYVLRDNTPRRKAILFFYNTPEFCAEYGIEYNSVRVIVLDGIKAIHAHTVKNMFKGAMTEFRSGMMDVIIVDLIQKIESADRNIKIKTAMYAVETTCSREHLLNLVLNTK